MANTISNVAVIFRSVASLALVGILGVGGYLAYDTFQGREALQRELEAKAAQIQELERVKQQLELANRLLKVDHRVAQINVLERREDGERPTTRFEFVELSDAGDPIGEKKEFTVAGDKVYVDAWVIKYDDSLVEANDPLRSTSVCLFRRVFGEFQEPDKGFPLDAKGSRPAAYSQGDEMSPVERDIWANFWEYANDPSLARAAGVRAVHGEAPNIKLEPGRRYRVELRASGGLSIVPEKDPPRDAT